LGFARHCSVRGTVTMMIEINRTPLMPMPIIKVTVADGNGDGDRHCVVCVDFSLLEMKGIIRW